MREIDLTGNLIWIQPDDIEGILNVQHNCYKSKCSVQKTRIVMIERRTSNSLDFEVVHEPTKNFILNSAAFYSSEMHRYWANLTFNNVSPEDWNIAVAKGIEKWKDSIKKKDDIKEKKREKEKEKILAGQPGYIPLIKKRKTRALGFSNLQSPVPEEGPVPGPSQF
ncbi:hypothetical protein DFH28DRAFT_474979 [Melampsora americana]|nr:hypothetical protein DFH28DRAFT_474979 [Melampsora americana]